MLGTINFIAFEKFFNKNYIKFRKNVFAKKKYYRKI